MAADMIRAISAILLGFGALSLAMVSITDPMGSGAVLMMVAATLLVSPAIYRAVQARDFGPAWIWGPAAAIWVSAVTHLFLEWSAGNLMGCVFILWGYGLFLTAREIGPAIFKVFAVAAAVESVLLIVVQLTNPHQSYGVLFAIAHFSVFVIIVGIVTCTERWRLPLAAIGVPAIILSGSEEGLWLLGVVGAVALWRRRQRRDWAIVGIGAAVLALALVSGIFGQAHPKMDGDRLDSWANITCNRAEPIMHAIDGDSLGGTGWAFDTRSTVPHIVPLYIATQYGALAGLAWLALPLGGLFRTRYQLLFVAMLAAAMVDHYLWTHLFPLAWILTGAAVERVTIGKQHVTAAAASDRWRYEASLNTR